MIKELIKTITVSLITLSLISVAHAWTEPESNPPSGNVSTPINAGSTYQYKNESLGLWSSEKTTSLDISGPLSGQWTASGINFGATDTGESNYWHLGYRGSLATNEYKNLTAWFYNGSSWISPLSLTSSGNVGIGTTVAGNKLTVSSATSLDGIHATNGSRWIRIMPGTVGTGSWNSIVQANDNAIIYSNGTQGTGNFVIAPWASGTSGLRMDASGNVGIGTTGPDSKLHVIGSICAESSDTGCAPTSGYVRGSGLCIGSDCRTSWPSGTSGSGTDNYIPRWNGTSALENSIITDDGTSANVWGKLNVFAASGAQSIFSTSDYNAYLYITPVATTDTDGYVALGAYDWSTPGQRGARTLALQSSGGNVGIGTTAPGEKLEINGNLKFTTANPYISASSYFIAPGGAYFNSGTVYTTAAIQARGGIANDQGDLNLADNVYISGNVGIGTTAPSQKLDVAGTVKSQGLILSGIADQVIYNDTKNASNNSAFYFTPSASSANSYIIANGSSATNIGNVLASYGSGWTGKYISINHDGNDGNVWSSSGDLVLNSASGNVGIGTTDPKATLDVQGYIRLKDYAGYPVTCDTSHAGVMFLAINSTYEVLYLCTGTKWNSITFDAAYH